MLALERRRSCLKKGMLRGIPAKAKNLSPGEVGVKWGWMQLPLLGTFRNRESATVCGAGDDAEGRPAKRRSLRQGAKSTELGCSEFRFQGSEKGREHQKTRNVQEKKIEIESLTRSATDSKSYT